MSDFADKARQQGERNYAIAFKKIVRDSEQEIDAAKARLAAKGALLSSGTWRIVAENLATRLEAILHARLDSLLNAYELYGVALDDEIEKRVLEDISNTRQTQLSNLTTYVSVQPWLRPQSEATTFISGQLAAVGDFLNEVKSAIEERRQKLKPSAEITPESANGPLVFVSCGQSTSAECDLGKQIAKLVESETGCTAYFAENQTSLEGVTENVLKRLHTAVAFIAVMHPRGVVSNPSDPSIESWVRGSVWVEQEIAIAAFMTQALKRPISVRAYVHETIRREGLQDKLHLNPIHFRNGTEILEDLQAFLPSWRELAQGRGGPLSLKRADLVLIEETGSFFIRCYTPGGTTPRLEVGTYLELCVSIENKGERHATITRYALRMDGMAEAVDLHPSPIACVFSRNSQQALNIAEVVKSYIEVPAEKLAMHQHIPFMLKEMPPNDLRQIACELTVTDTEGNTAKTAFTVTERGA